MMARSKEDEAVDEDKLNPLEKIAMKRSQQFKEGGRAYAIEQGSRTSTIGHVLSSSPLALLAWCVSIYIQTHHGSTVLRPH